jgi:hypothetical protein
VETGPEGQRQVGPSDALWDPFAVGPVRVIHSAVQASSLQLQRLREVLATQPLRLAVLLGSQATGVAYIGRHMSHLEPQPYTLQIASLVAKQLQKFSTCSAYHLAGHLENLDFWLSEASRVVRVIDDYSARFVRLRDAQVGFVESHRATESPWCPYCSGACEFGPFVPSPPQRIPTSELESARRAVRDATYAFLLRCFRAGGIDQARLRAGCDQVGTSVDMADVEKIQRDRKSFVTE